MAIEKTPLLSYADFSLLPPESPGEVIEGELIVGPAPQIKHQRIVMLLAHRLYDHLERHPKQGEAFAAPTDVVLRAERPAIVLQPDLFFVSSARIAMLGTDAMRGAPDLVVEVVSPSKPALDAQKKRDLYDRHGVDTYWLVWPEDARIDVFTRGPGGRFGPAVPHGLADTLTTPLLPGFSLAVARVFASR